MTSAVQSLANDQLLPSPTAVSFPALELLGSMDGCKPLKSLLDTTEVLSKATVNAKAGSLDNAKFGTSLTTLQQQIKKFEDWSVRYVVYSK